MKKSLYWISAITMVWMGAASAADKPVAGANNRPPDIVIFITDDQSRLDATPYGIGNGIRTPNIQRLADEGLTFNHAFVASPSCAPSRAALLTGLMPARSGAEANHSKPRADIKKWPAYLQELGYEVVAFGKVAHYLHTADYGFDSFGNDGFHDHAGIPAAVEFLRKRKHDGAKPLCLFVGTNWPHVPWPNKAPQFDPAKLVLPAGSIDTPATRDWRTRYAAAVTKADVDLGLVLAAARETLPEKSLFLYSADHGAQWPFAKWNLYEAGVSVPMIVSWPGTIKPGTRSGAMVQWIDLLPTMVEVAGGAAPGGIDGKSFLPVLLGKADGHRERIFTTHANDKRMNIYPARAVRDSQWKYIRNLHPEFAFTTHIDLVGGSLGQREFFATWEEAAKTDPKAAAILQRYHARPAEELYDLAADPDEQNNLAGDPEHAAKLGSLRAELDAWMKDQGDMQKVIVAPRLLNDPASFGPGGVIEGKPK
jgi:N-sulfoglucosamine sulfohydrolase